MSFVSSRIWAAQQVIRGIRNAKGVFLLALMLASLTLTIPVFFSGVIYSLTEPLSAIPLEPQITVFTDKKITTAAKDNLVARIGRHENVIQINLIAKEDALSALNENLGIKEDSKDKDANPLPDLIIVTLSNDLSPQAIEKTAKNIEKLNGVEMIAYDSTWLTKLHALRNTGQVVTMILGSITLALIVLVVAASVRLAADAHKTELNMLYLFGASPSFTVRPYAWRGFLTMGLAACIAIGLSYICFDTLNEALAIVASQYGTTIAVRGLPFEYNALFILFCAFLGGIIASIITRRAIARIERR